MTNVPLSQRRSILELESVEKQDNLVLRNSLLDGNLGPELLNRIVWVDHHRHIAA